MRDDMSPKNRADDLLPENVATYIKILRILHEMGVSPTMVFIAFVAYQGVTIMGQYTLDMHRNFDKLNTSFQEYARKTDHRLTVVETMIAKSGKVDKPIKQ